MVYGSERRGEERRKELLALVFHHAQEVREVHTLDVSRSGALLAMPVGFGSGTLLILDCPSLCVAGKSTRVLARVARVSRIYDRGGGESGVGVAWLRAYSSAGREVLSDFLVDKLGFAVEDITAIEEQPTGDVVFDFARPQREARSERPPDRELSIAQYRRSRDRLTALQRGRFRLQTAVTYSIQNMHCRGSLFSLGPTGVAFATRSAMPFGYSRFQIRYPVESSVHATRVLFFCETELVIDPAYEEPGLVSARLTGIDELETPGVFRTHMRMLAEKYTLW